MTDILLIRETHFTTKSCIKIPQHNTYYTNHPDGNAHAVAAVIVKQTISHYELPKYEEDFFQATFLRVRTLPYKLTVTAVYSPPKYTLKKDHYAFMAGGDYNSKHTAWGSRKITTKGRELFSLLQGKNYSLSTGNPTYWPTDPTKQSDLLDFFVTNGISSTYTNIEHSYDLSSGHPPVIATISTSPYTRWFKYDRD